MNIGALTAHLGCDMTAFNASIKKAEAKLTGFSSKMVATGKMMQGVGRTMSLALTLPIAAIGVGAFKLSKDFEASMDKIVGLVGVAEEQVESWSAEILKLGPELGKSPKELADAMFFITSAGIKGAEALDVLNMSAKGSAAGLGETKVVADLVTSAMNAYGKENLSAAAATDILVGTVREGKAEAPELVAAMGQVLPIASEMKVQFDEVGAAIAGMTRTGTSAATASMQLKQILASLLKPTQQAEEALGSMGTSSAELRKTIREDGLITALTDIKVTTEEYGETAMAKVFPNIRALSGVLDLMGSNAEDNIAIFNSLADSTGSLDTAFEAASKTAEFKLDQAVASFKTTLTAIGKTVQEAIIPMLENFTAKLTSLSTWFQNLSDVQKKWAVRIAGIVAALGPMLMILGKLLVVIPKVSGAIASMMKFLAANPWLLLAAAIAVVIIALIRIRKANQKVAISMKKFNKELFTQKTELNYVFDSLEKAAGGTDAHKEAIKKVNSQYGKYLPFLLRENATLKEIKLARILATDALTKEIAEKHRQLALEDIGNDYLDKSFDISEKIRKQVEKKKGVSASKEAVADLEELVKLRASIGDKDDIGMKSWRRQMLDYQAKLITYTEDYGLKVRNVRAQVVDLSVSLKAQNKEMANVNNFYDAQGTSADKILKTEQEYTKETLKQIGNDITKLETQKKNNTISEKGLKTLDKLISQKEKLIETQNELNRKEQASATQKQLVAVQKSIDLINNRKRISIEDEITLNKLQVQKNALIKKQKELEALAPPEVVEVVEDVIITPTGVPTSTAASDAYADQQKLQALIIANMEEGYRKQMALETLKYGAITKNLEESMTDKVMLDKFIEQEEIAHLKRLEQIIEEFKPDPFEVMPMEDEENVDDAPFLAIIADLKDYEDAMKSITAQQEVWGESFDAVGMQISALKTNINKLITEGIGLEGEALKLNQEEIEEQLVKYNELMAKQEEEIAKLNAMKEAGRIVADAMSGAMKAMADSMVASMVFAEDAQGRFMSTLISGALDMIITYMAMAMAAAIYGGGEAGAATGPGAAIATPVFIAELLAVVIAAFATIPEFATGGSVIQSGAFLVGENGPEIANLKAGSGVVPNNMLNSFGLGGDADIELSTKVTGNDLEIIGKRAKAQSKRR